MGILKYYGSLLNGEAYRNPDKYIGAILMLCFIITVMIYVCVSKFFFKYRMFISYAIRCACLGKCPSYRRYLKHRDVMIIRQQRMDEKSHNRQSLVNEREKELQQLESILCK